jgi:hypothetical protein
MRFAIVLKKQKIDNPWQNYRWRPVEVVPDIGQFGKALELAGTENYKKVIGRFLERNDQEESWLYAGFDFNFFRDEAEGYFLNSTSPEPCWFVMWRLESDYQDYLEPESMVNVENEDGAGLAVPHRLMLSYNEAARLIDGGEQVDTAPLQSEMKVWLADYVAANYKPETKKRARPASFKGANRPAES